MPVCHFWRVKTLVCKIVIFVCVSASCGPPAGCKHRFSCCAIWQKGSFKQLNESCGPWPQSDRQLCVSEGTICVHCDGTRLWKSVVVEWWVRIGLNCTLVSDFSYYKQNSNLTSWEMYTQSNNSAYILLCMHNYLENPMACGECVGERAGFLTL